VTRPLDGAVAVVAGGTRGAGRGIAVELGAAGATVYVTGRSTKGRRSEMDRPETIEETAGMVQAFGGTGIPVRVDHLVHKEVASLFKRVRDEQKGRLNLLVNDIWGGDPLTEWGTPFWELSLDKGFRMLELAIHAHVVTSRFGVPLMVAQGSGLVVEVTDGIGPGYRGNLFYDLAKSSVVRLAFGMAEELRERGVVAVAVSPGFLRSEAVLDHFGVTEETWRDAVAQDRHFAASETPRYVGRAVAALASDPEVMARSGQALSSWDLAAQYGFTDVDGSRPDWGTWYREQVEGSREEA
jgi:NAD(P)-dependent dehydrogenase (short-subunit alcohol dehydrogenase family)